MHARLATSGKEEQEQGRELPVGCMGRIEGLPVVRMARCWPPWRRLMGEMCEADRGSLVREVDIITTRITTLFATLNEFPVIR